MLLICIVLQILWLEFLLLRTISTKLLRILTIFSSINQSFPFAWLLMLFPISFNTDEFLFGDFNVHNIVDLVVELIDLMNTAIIFNLKQPY